MSGAIREFKKILITGITGSGGSYLAEYIVNNHPEVEVHGISRWHSAGHHNNVDSIKNKITIHECDLLDVSSIIRVLELVKPDGIFHIASYANVKNSFITPLSVINNNVMGTANLLEAIRLLSLDPVIQFCSTSEVYGKVDPKNVPINESCPINAVNPYSVSKVTQDLLGQSYFLSYGMKVIRTRMFTYINPRRLDLFATSFADQIAQIELGKQQELCHGNLDSTRTLIDVRDAMESYWVALTKGKIGEVYNIGGDNVYKVGEVLEILKSKSIAQIPSRLNKSLLRPADITLQIPDSSKFYRETGWRPKYSFEQSLDFLLQYRRDENSQ
ncbi:GDP-mannose 4,6-dehydratase [Shewanella sp. UCD-KL12]|uniref:GDP-mannose 4,6-dehydratase n=1 Tax=Shewanella sp. UCD-KL12 TaxID=1917163 RepID=UPI000970B6CE|nr:GDP-mannose 4,6-dehydratase [Shewanella sp. UCD-KL12]